MMLNILWSIIIGFGVFFFSVMAESLFEHEGFIQKTVENGVTVRKFRLASADGWLRPILLGVAVGGLTFLGVTFKMTTFFAVVMLIGLFAVVCYLVYWWQKDGNKLKEFAVMSVVVFLTTVAMWWVAACVKAPIQNSGWRSLIGVVPIVVFVIAIATMAYFGLRSYAEEKEGSNMGSVAMVVLIIGIIIAALVLGFGVKWQNFFTEAAVTPVAAANVTEEYVFLNDNLQTDEDAENDFNFGPSPEVEVDAKDRAEQLRDVHISTFGGVKNQVYAGNTRPDILSGVGTMNALDHSILKTDFLHDFRVDGKTEDEVMNDAIEYYMHHLDVYREKAVQLAEVLRTFTVSIWKGKAKDQMFAMPARLTGGLGHPKLVIFEAKDVESEYLVYTLDIQEKGIFERLLFHVPCRFQPANQGERMGITPQTWPKSEPTPSDDNPPSPSEPTPTPYHKDPNDRMPIIPDDDPGPGPDTNNPDDPWHSTEDQPDNSNHMSYEEYRDWTDELEEINESQRVAGDPNTPTVTPAPDTVLVDSNADKGTGYGGADDATPESSPAKEEDGDTIVNANTGDDDSKAGTQWSGPKD